MKKDYKRLSSEIQALNAETNRITDIIDQEQTEKEFELKRIKTEYTKLKASSLPLFKKYNAIEGVWLYKLHISEGRLVLHKMVVSNGKVQLFSLVPSSMFDEDIIEATEKEWHDGVCKLLKIID
jgi:hypothetical protein